MAWALLAAALFTPTGVGEARPYTVVSCDAGLGSPFASEAWVPTTSIAGSSYDVCPTQGSLNAGISNRITSATVSALAFSAHTFYAPADTRITGFRWGGRFARGNCRWGTFVQAFPSRSVLFGLRPNTLCESTGLDIRGATVPWAVPAGTTAVQQIILCGASSCPPGATFHSVSTVVTIDDPTVPVVSASGALVAGRWVRGDQIVAVIGRDNTGIARSWATLGQVTTPLPWSCRYTRSRPCADQTGNTRISTNNVVSGPHQVVVGAQDAAGNVAYAQYTAHIDNEPPGRTRPVVVDGEAWRRADGFAVRWENPPQAHAPILRAWYRLCGPRSCSIAAVNGGVETLEQVMVGESGEHTLQVWLEDEAGNQSYALSASDPVHLRLDQEAPRLVFEPQSQADPLRVAVTVDDRHAGLDTGEIEMRRRGGDAWQSLATARAGQRLVSYVDDERFRSGAYEFRARARDRAGNEASTDRRANGARATIDLPARFTTRLSVGRRRTVRRGRRRLVRLAPSASAKHATRLKLHGILTNSDGQPIDGASIEVASDSPGDAVGLLPVGLARTDRDGRFTYVVRATRNKVLRFRYSGTRSIRAATGDFELRVPAASSIRARPRRLRNGQIVQLSGVVDTRPLPPGGKLIEVQAYFRGRFRTFSTTRADANGRWRFAYRFGGTRGRVPYRLRAFLPAEGGYPFVTGRSPVLRVLVVGP